MTSRFEITGDLHFAYSIAVIQSVNWSYWISYKNNSWKVKSKKGYLAKKDWRIWKPWYLAFILEYVSILSRYNPD